MKVSKNIKVKYILKFIDDAIKKSVDKREFYLRARECNTTTPRAWKLYLSARECNTTNERAWQHNIAVYILGELKTNLESNLKNKGIIDSNELVSVDEILKLINSSIKKRKSLFKGLKDFKLHVYVDVTISILECFKDNFKEEFLNKE